ncbi:MAG: S8 family serine peptidase [Candidatus Cloacimonetes bacterium]|nr:S8 family serine peptidase [Candidatus Cloacimonadota bacterium]
MRVWACIILVAFVVANLVASDCEPGRVAFKVRGEYKHLLRLSGCGCGIASIDRQLSALGVDEVKRRFVFDASKRTADMPDLSLIIEASFPSRLSPQGMASLLERDPHIDWAEPIFIDSLLAVPDDPYYSTSPYLAAMQAEAAWDIHKGEDGAQETIVAIVDTGTNWLHPDLGDNIWQNLGEDADGDGLTMLYDGGWVFDTGDLNGVDDDGNGYVDDLIGWDFMLDGQGNQGNDPYDSSSHGTRTGGVAAMVTNNAIGGASISWNVSLMPLSCSHPGSGSIYRGYDAILYAAENGAAVINCSWGGSTFSQANQDIIDYAWGLDGVVVAAAGNGNNTARLYPACYAHVVAVASAQNSGVKTAVSTFGPQIDVCAPSDSIFTTEGSGYTWVHHYTSYASPVAAGLAALIASQHPEWAAATLVNQLVATCDDIDALNPGLENQLGQGMLNAQRALSEVNPQVDQELRPLMHEVGVPTDANGNGAVEPGEQFSLNLTLLNHSLVGDSLSCTLSTSNSQATILDDQHSVFLPADGYAELEDAFLVEITPGATSQHITFTLTIAANLPIITATQFDIKILVNAGGVFVWSAANNSYISGYYIRTELLGLGHPVLFSNTFPTSLFSFDAAYLCFGTPGGNIQRLNSLNRYTTLKDYLESGGRLFIEGGDIIGWDMAILPVGGDTLASDVLWPLLGLSDADDGGDHVITGLSGDHGWLTQGQNFSASTQSRNYSIDTFTPGVNGVEGFCESDYGVVAVQGVGEHGQRTFVFSYALRELVDEAPPSTSHDLVARIHEFLTTDSLSLPVVDSLAITHTATDSLRLSWSYPFGVDGFDVFSDDSPDGDFSTMVGETAQTWLDIDATTLQRRFYRVVARRMFGVSR